jgi:hypothetical protein
MLCAPVCIPPQDGFVFLNSLVPEGKFADRISGQLVTRMDLIHRMFAVIDIGEVIGLPASSCSGLP